MNAPIVDVAVLSAMITGILEFAKIYLPDNLEPKILPILAVIIGGVFGYLNPAIGIINGIVTGATVTGIYKAGKDTIKDMGTGSK